jgi:hypothetical protein
MISGATLSMHGSFPAIRSSRDNISGNLNQYSIL